MFHKLFQRAAAHFIGKTSRSKVHLIRNVTNICPTRCTRLLSTQGNLAHYHRPVFNTQRITTACNNVTVHACLSGTSEKVDFKNQKNVVIQNQAYQTDEWTNVSPKILSYLGKNLHLKKDHPLCLIKDSIVEHFYSKYMKSTRTPLFAVFDNFSPVVSTFQNFDSMLVRKDHVSRAKSDNYYINESTLLRAHTSAHEHDLLKSGLDAFIVVGDVYRRDTIDSSHFPVFHQIEGVRLFNKKQLFAKSQDSYNELKIFEDGSLYTDKQACHTLEASKLVEMNLKQTLEDLVCDLFGKDVVYRWVDAYFPFTHPSFEMEIFFGGEWMEMLGCGILQQEILNTAGAKDSIGWAFGLGLERLAMRLFNIPDIRYFWCQEDAFLSQFRGCKNIKDINFKPMLSNQPPVVNDMSFWVPDEFCSNDFYDLVRSLDTGIIESVILKDSFVHPKTNKSSHCYSIFYRHTSRPLTKTEVNVLHNDIQTAVVTQLNVVGRW
uniref:Phenylalanine--tRNA ligase, mitochondrial n=1 Tax=Phallusia mammillata TaxID=59560 RepID=A0A6F9DDD4_9ASCI|nr:phenylalanine--tRNA ligase, mitochondrial [Phallusia mammillata]